MYNKSISLLINGLTKEGFATFKIVQKIQNWKNNYEFIVNPEDGIWWRVKAGAYPSGFAKSGQIFKTTEEAELTALIHFCNNNNFDEVDKTN